MVLLWLAVFSLLTFAAFGADKFRARTHRFRLPEALLLGLSLAGGAMGGLAAMYLFRHKTKKPLFVLSLPLLFLMQTTFALWLWIH